MGREGSHAATARVGRDGKLMRLGWRRCTKLGGNLRLDVGYAHHNILWLDVRVHEVALVVQILQAEENLPGNAFDDAGGNAFPAVLLDEGE